MQREAKQGRVGGMEVPGERFTGRYEDCEAEEILDKENQHKEETSSQSGGNNLNILRAFYINTRSVVNIDKRTELELYVDKEKPDIIGITESWAKESIQDSELELEGYAMFRKDRDNRGEKRHGGGVLLYIKDSLTALERSDLRDDRFKESVWCEIRNKAETLLVGVCYRVPDSSEESDSGLQELIDKATKMSCIIMGDFNYHIDWNKREGKNKADELFLECMDEHFLTQHVTEPTRGNNTLDLVISTEENLVEEVTVGEEFGTSDHQIIRFRVNGEYGKEIEAYQKRYNYFKADYDKVRSKIREKGLARRLADLNLNERWKQIESCMKRSLKKQYQL